MQLPSSLASRQPAGNGAPLHYRLVCMSMALPFVDRSNTSLPVQFVLPSKWRSWLKEQSAPRRAWLDSLGASGQAGDFAVLRGRRGKGGGAVLLLSAKATLGAS